MGNCDCNYCPGELQTDQITNIQKGFPVDIQAQIDSLREKHKVDIKNSK